ncbi:hypothetical protein P3W53_24850 [Pseudomonas denitrificans (nom. rej.)]|nr:hypothetical protein [Pseudomonas denitrificans (nom. rej.)]
MTQLNYRHSRGIPTKHLNNSYKQNQNRCYPQSSDKKTPTSRGKVSELVTEQPIPACLTNTPKDAFHPATRNRVKIAQASQAEDFEEGTVGTNPSPQQQKQDLEPITTN